MSRRRSTGLSTAPRPGDGVSVGKGPVMLREQLFKANAEFVRFTRKDEIHRRVFSYSPGAASCSAAR